MLPSNTNKNRTARGLQYSGPVITLRVQYGLQIHYNTIPIKKIREAPKGRHIRARYHYRSLTNIVLRFAISADFAGRANQTISTVLSPLPEPRLKLPPVLHTNLPRDANRAAVSNKSAMILHASIDKWL